MNIRDLRNKISFGFGAINSIIEIENPVNDMSFNVILETPFLDILNITYGYELINCNTIKKNYDAVDGIDATNNIFVQVTSTFSTEKIEKTIDKILELELLNEESTLIFMFLKQKANLSKKFKDKIEKKIDGKFKFDFEFSLLSTKDIFKSLSDFSDIDKLIGVSNILDTLLDGITKDNTGLFEKIGVSFHEEEFDNVVVLIKCIIDKRLNVVINSRKMYNFFKDNEQTYFDSLILYKSGMNLDDITKTIVVVSFEHVNVNRDSDNLKCPLMIKCSQSSCSPLVIKFIEHDVITKHSKLKRPKKVSAEINRINQVLNDFFLDISATYYSIESVKNFIIGLNRQYKSHIVTEDTRFCLLRITNEDFDINTNFLIFGSDYEEKEVLNELNKDLKNNLYSNLTILIPRENKSYTNSRLDSLRKKNIDINQGKVNIQYIDNYFYIKSLNSIKLHQPAPSLIDFESKLFMEPVFLSNEHPVGLNDILYWLNNDSDKSVSFIFGAGGIGKTTVGRKIQYEISNDVEEKIVIFFNVKDYIGEIRRRHHEPGTSNFNIEGIFDIASKQIINLDLETFKLNFEFGNIIMIIDGIDEVISTLSNFQIENFIKDLESIKISLSKGKLLINCRDFYLSELKEKIEDFEAKYNIFKLLEFNSVQAEKYFEKKFQVPKGEKNPKKDDAVRILKEFVFNQEDKFSPYIFDSIALIVEAKNADIDTDPEFESKLLVKNYKIDFINYRICQREITKKQEGVDINIDAYIKFLCLVAIEGKGIFRKEDFSGYLYKADESLANIDMENAIRDNPFLINENNHFSFRYDFQNIVFKQIAIYSIITLPETFKLNYDFIEVLAQNLRYNSVVTKALYDKFRASEKTVDDFLEDVKKIIERISIYDNDGDNNHLNLLKSEAISNLTVLLINIYNSKNPIEIVARLFSSNVESKSERIELNGVCFVNIPPESGLVFNFEDCIFHNSFIKNFPNFIECGFNSNTHFDKTNKICELNYNNYISKKGSIKKINFDEEIFNTDNSLLKIIKVLEGAGENTKKNLKRYFKTFYINNRIIDFRININSISNKENFLLPVEMITKILLKYGIVADYNGDIIKLNRDFYGRINKYLEGDMPFLELNRAIKEINEEIIKLSA